MPLRTVLWMLAFAIAVLGAASAASALQASPDAATTNDGSAAAASDASVAPEEGSSLVGPSGPPVVPDLPDLPVDPQPLVDEATTAAGGGLPVHVDAGLAVDAQIATSVGLDGDDGTHTSPSGEASLGAKVLETVPDDPVGRSVFAGILLGALALVVEAFRFLLGKLGAPVARALRALAAIAPAFALFSRIDRGSLLENPVRARVHDAIAQDPGMSLSEVSARAGIAWGTTVHHLRRLEQHGMIVSVDQAPHRRFFAANTPAAAHRTAVAVILQPTARRIAELVHARPGIDQTGVCQLLGLKNPSASKHLRAFESQGLVESARDGRSRHYHPTEALGSALGIVQRSSMSVGSRQHVTTRIPALPTVVAPLATRATRAS